MSLGKLTIGNIWEDLPDANNLYIGRVGKGVSDSPLQNPYKITGNVTRESVIEDYRKYLNKRLAHNTPQKAEMTKIAKLLLGGENVNLQCFCHTKHSKKPCHGEVIKEIVDEAIEKFIKKTQGDSDGNQRH